MRKMIRQIMTLATLCWMVAGCADEVIDYKDKSPSMHESWWCR